MALKNIRGAEDIPLNRPSGDVVAAQMLNKADEWQQHQMFMSEIRQYIHDIYKITSIGEFLGTGGKGIVSPVKDSPMELSLTLDLNGKKERVNLRSGSAITISSPFDLQVAAEQWNKTQMGNTTHKGIIGGSMTE